jgi:hypothetical protein
MDQPTSNRFVQALRKAQHLAKHQRFGSVMQLSHIFALLIALPCLSHAEQWFKGNTHTHSLWSDGNDFPEMIADWYVQHGYHFLAFTDHNIMHDKEVWMSVANVEKRRKAIGKTTMQKYTARFGPDWVQTREMNGEQEVRLKQKADYASLFEKPGQFLLMNGEEISASFKGAPLHMNALNLQQTIEAVKDQGDSVETLRQNLRNVKAQSEKLGVPMITHLNHPNFRWALTADELAAVLEENYFEIYNGHPLINYEGDTQRDGHERIWDIVNTLRLRQHKGQPLFGVGTDDSHNYHGESSRPGRGWVMVKAKELAPSAIIAAMEVGDFYASSGVTLDSVSYSSGKLRIQIKAEAGVSYRTEIRGTLKQHDTATQIIAVADPKDPHKTRIQHSQDIGKVLATLEGSTIEWSPTGQELYFRAIITSSKAHPDPSYEAQHEMAWTQPMGWR